MTRILKKEMMDLMSQPDEMPDEEFDNGYYEMEEQLAREEKGDGCPRYTEDFEGWLQRSIRKAAKDLRECIAECSRLAADAEDGDARDLTELLEEQVDTALAPAARLRFLDRVRYEFQHIVHGESDRELALQTLDDEAIETIKWGLCGLASDLDRKIALEWLEWSGSLRGRFTAGLPKEYDD